MDEVRKTHLQLQLPHSLARTKKLCGIDKTGGCSRLGCLSGRIRLERLTCSYCSHALPRAKLLYGIDKAGGWMMLERPACCCSFHSTLARTKRLCEIDNTGGREKLV